MDKHRTSQPASHRGEWLLTRPRRNANAKTDINDVILSRAIQGKPFGKERPGE
jgi:hypothetical protein